MKISDQTARVAAEWWADKIDGTKHHDNGDKTMTGVLSMMLADMGSYIATDEQLSIFVDSLSKAIVDAASDCIPSLGVYLGSDYGPSDLLCGAADDAKINYLNFPFKTHMYVHENLVEVSDGYAQPYEVIYREESEK